MIQKLANNEKFDTESPHLMPLNKWLDKNRDKLKFYLKQITKDPLEQGSQCVFEKIFTVCRGKITFWRFT